MKKNMHKVALFFDCENIPSIYTAEIYNKLSEYGEVVISKAYANWNAENHKSWKEILNAYTIEQIQPVTKLKNSADIRIIIDVMKTMKMSHIDAIALVSNDSDFTELAIEGQSRGIEMIGIGYDQAPSVLRNAYTEFILLSTRIKRRATIQPMIDSCTLAIDDPKNKYSNQFMIKHLHTALRNIQKERGYTQNPNSIVYLSQIAAYFKDTFSLTPKMLGFKQWKNIIAAYPKEFRIKKDKKTYYVQAIHSKKI